MAAYDGRRRLGQYVGNGGRNKMEGHARGSRAVRADVPHRRSGGRAAHSDPGFFSEARWCSDGGAAGFNVFLNYRVGLDYAHSMVYFDIGKTFEFPDFDVVGLVLRPQDDGGYTILGVADFDGKSSVPTGPDGVEAGDHLEAINDIPVHGVTMGQVWAMLGGTPGQGRRLRIERGGKEFTVAAKVQHFLAEAPDEKESKRK